jgi:predicted DNA-binding transcriptional regulator YafY
MPEVPQIIRQWTMLKMLAARRFGTSVYELADEMSVNQKTVRRDLQSLSSLGFPLEEKTVDHGKKLWSVKTDSGLPGLTLNLTEVLSLYVGRRLMEPLAGTLFWDGAASSYRKIRSTLGERAVRYLDRLDTLLHFSQSGTSDYTDRAELIDGLMVAIEDRNITFLVYQSMRSTEPVSREIYPLGLSHFRGSLYLVAHAVEEDAIRHYKIDRVTDVDIQNLKFVRPDGFDLQEWMSSSFGVFRSGIKPKRIVIQFDREVARYVSEHKWHASQKLTINKDGSITANFELSDYQEIMRWVMSFGSSAKAIEPPELVDAIRQDVEKMTDVYSRDHKANE